MLEQVPYAQWKTTAHYRSKLGVEKATFDLLLCLTEEKLEQVHGDQVQTSESKELLSTENLLALLLNWIAEYRTERALSVDFHIPQQTVHRYLPLLVDLTHEELQKFVSPPVRIQRKVDSGLLKGACLFVDSFPIPLVYRPGYAQKECVDRSSYYWFAGGKTQKWAIKVQVALGLDGRIWDMSKAVPYATSDQKLYRESAVPAILARGADLKGVGDSHYSKQSQFIPKSRNPKRKREKDLNKAIEKMRASVEHSIERLKNSPILKGPYRGDRSNLTYVEKVARIVAALINIEAEIHPIQADLRGWKRLRQVAE